MTKRIAIGIVFIAGAATLGGFVFNWRARSNTEYVPQWNETLFVDLQTGDSLEKAWRTLGTPVDIVMYQMNTVPNRPRKPWNMSDICKMASDSSTVCVLQYSRPKNDRIEIYRNVRIDFRSGKITGKTDGIYHELW